MNTQKNPQPIGQIKSTAYYQARYVQQGESGFFRDSKSCVMIHQDALAAQRDWARRLTSAVSVGKGEGSV